METPVGIGLVDPDTATSFSSKAAALVAEIGTHFSSLRDMPQMQCLPPLPRAASVPVCRLGASSKNHSSLAMAAVAAELNDWWNRWAIGEDEEELRLGESAHYWHAR
ncbi:hypothetical protein CYMTET_33697, partial [Cymbomonas tetramitiformis]